MTSSSNPRHASFLGSLSDPLRSIARDCVPSDAAADTKPSAVRADELEIQLRSRLLTLVQKSLSTGTGNTALDDVGHFWKSALDLCVHLVYFSEQGCDARYTGMSVRKLPLLLLEDALDALPLSSFQLVWQQTVEPAFGTLFSDLLWHPTPTSFPCSLPFIKLCNKLLRKLHHQQEREWPARILLTLSSAFSLSDKSATKIWGSFNTDNVTEFETEEQFEAGQQLLKQQDGAANGEETLTSSKHHQQYQSYSFYQTFWSVQQDFSNPTGIKFANFLDRMRTILAALESHPLIRSPNQNNHKTTEAKSAQEPVKYLTSSHLLPIQLGDAGFRCHFLTQFLIVEHHLSAESPTLAKMLAPLHQRATSLLQHIEPQGAQQLEFLEFILAHREKHWRQWKRHKCQPDLETPLVQMEQEEHEPAEADKTNSPAAGQKRKRLLDGPLGAGEGDDHGEEDSGKPKGEEEQLLQFILHEKKDLKTTCSLDRPRLRTKKQRLGSNNNKHRGIPSLEDYLEPYADALDPDAGIEAEYHPKNDPLFTWRALRLLSRDHLGKFHMVTHKGDFEKMVRHIYKEEKGVDIPGEAPVEDHLHMADHVSPVVDVTATMNPPEDEEDRVENVLMENNDDIMGFKVDDEGVDDEEHYDDGDRRSLDEGQRITQDSNEIMVDSQPPSPAERGEASPSRAIDSYDNDGEDIHVNEQTDEVSDDKQGGNDQNHGIKPEEEGGHFTHGGDDGDRGELLDENPGGDRMDVAVKFHDGDSDGPMREQDGVYTEDEGEERGGLVGDEDDDGEIEESQRSGRMPSPPSQEADGQDAKGEDITDHPENHESTRSQDSDSQEKDAGGSLNGRNDEGQNRSGAHDHGRRGRGPGGGNRPEQRNTSRPPSPTHRGDRGPRGGPHRSGADGPSYNTYPGKSSQDEGRSGPHHQLQQHRAAPQQHRPHQHDTTDRRGGGSGGGPHGRDSAPPGAPRRGGPEAAGGGGGRRDDRRGGDDRWEDRRGGAAASGGGGGTGGGRRRGPSSGGDRRSGGRGDGRPRNRR